MLHLCKKCTTEKSLNFPKDLPKEYSYLICQNVINNEEIAVTIRCNVTTHNQMKTWLKQYLNISTIKWEWIQTTFEKTENFELDQKNFKAEFCCPNKNDGKHKMKKRECPARFILSMYKAMKNKKGTDSHAIEMAMKIEFKGCHIHNTPNMLSKISFPQLHPENLIDKFTTFYSKYNFSPFVAFNTHLLDVHQLLSCNINLCINDPNHFPSLTWCQNLYEFVRNDIKIYPNINSAIWNAIRKYTQLYGTKCIEVNFYQNSDDYYMLFITPLMRRLHLNLLHGFKLCYIASACLHPGQSPMIYMLFSNSECTGIPLAVIVVSTNREDILKEVFEVYRKKLPSLTSRPWLPQVFVIAEDSNMLRSALQEIFPNSQLRIAMPQLIFMVWNYINSNLCTTTEERFAIMKHVYTFLSSDIILLPTILNNIKEDKKINIQGLNLREFERLMEELDEEKSNLAARLYPAGAFRGVNVTNPSTFLNEQMLIGKDVIIYSLLCLPLDQMIHFLFSKMDYYYGGRIEDEIKGRKEVANLRRFFVDIKEHIPKSAVTNDGDLCYVMHNNENYTIHGKLGICSCPIFAMYGLLCVHQYAVALHTAKHCIMEEKQRPAVTNSVRAKYFFIATGRKYYSQHDRWFPEQDLVNPVLNDDTPSCSNAELRGPVLNDDTPSCSNAELRTYNQDTISEENELMEIDNNDNAMEVEQSLINENGENPSSKLLELLTRQQPSTSQVQETSKITNTFVIKRDDFGFQFNVTQSFTGRSFQITIPNFGFTHLELSPAKANSNTHKINISEKIYHYLGIFTAKLVQLYSKRPKKSVTHFENLQQAFKIKSHLLLAFSLNKFGLPVHVLKELKISDSYITEYKNSPVKTFDDAFEHFSKMLDIIKTDSEIVNHLNNMASLYLKLYYEIL